MEQLHYPTEEVHEGPFLIDRNQLGKFDEIVDAQWSRLCEWHRAQVEAEAERCIADPPYHSYTELSREEVIAKVEDEYEWRPNHREIKVQFKGGKSATAGTFADLVCRPDIEDLVPTSFSVTLHKGPIRTEIEPSYGSTTGSGYRVRINSQSELAHGLKAAFSNWLRNASPSWWVKLWARATWAFPVQWVLVLLVGYAFILVWGGSDTPREIAVREYRKRLGNEAGVLLEDGLIRDEEIADAIRISLELAVDYVPPDVEIGARRVPMPWLWALGISALLALLLSFRPSFGLAVGKGAPRVIAWRRWLGFVGGTLPLGIVTYFVLPWLGRFLWN